MSRRRREILARFLLWERHPPSPIIIACIGGNMKLFVICLSILFVFTTWFMNINANINATAWTSELELADDASTPEKKSEYLDQFIKKAESERVAEYGAVFYKNEKTKVNNQIDVLRSLKKRCDDLGPLNKESMGYSQGMTQVTGQEFHHAVGHIREVFNSAYQLYYYGSFWYFSSYWSWLVLILAVCTFYGKDILDAML
jgi:hypothetical protein